MGPPIFVGGEAHLHREGRDNCRLQWATHLWRWRAEATRRCWRGPRKWRFNGATALRRWRADGSSGREQLRIVASMRPPIFVGGELVPLRLDIVDTKLQWGHRSSSVESEYNVALTACHHYWLQWGHRSSSVERSSTTPVST